MMVGRQRTLNYAMIYTWNFVKIDGSKFWELSKGLKILNLVCMFHCKLVLI